MRNRLERLTQAEAQRPFTHYGRFIQSEDTLGDDVRLQLSPIVRAKTPAGILAWFSFDRREGPEGEIDIFVGENTFGREGVVEGFRPILDEFRQRRTDEDRWQPSIQGTEARAVPLSEVAVHLARERYAECLQKCSDYMAGRMLTTEVTDFNLQFYVDDDGKPRAIASRRIHSLGIFDDLPDEAECLTPLVKGFGLQQGFLIDVNWLLRDLPWEISEQVLDIDESLQIPAQALPMDSVDTVFATIFPVRELGFETFREEDETYGQLEVRISTENIARRFRTQERNFLAVALMLVLTLATGMTLLYRSVNRELEQAHREQNFVAAVTHELRTPLSTIRLHGEMLLEGWISNSDQKQEYYRRIVRETDRLSTLVENVLSKSRMKEDVVEPEALDLNDTVSSVRADLANADGSLDDLAFDLAPRLPNAWLIPDGVAGTLSNLVENARKYAPAKLNEEPILIRTRYDGERVLLEVADRGPGVPKAEREKIFNAFYRVGSEATRTATGTGLGLHLVRMHADAAGALVSMTEREGGGSVFRVAYRAAV